MRLQLTTIAVLAAAALAAGLAGCGSEEELPMRTISVQGPTSGPLAARAMDIRRAVALELQAIDGDTKGSRLRIVEGPDPEALATIDALARVPVSGRSQLSITLTPPVAREAKRQRRPSPQIWLLPPDGLTSAARSSYVVSGTTGARTATADNPWRPGTPSGHQYVTPALTAENYPTAGQDFFNKFNDTYDRAPDRYAIYGYEALGLIVDALTRLETAGAPVTQSSLAESALAVRDRFSPVGHYDVLPSGQTTLYVFQARGKGAPPGQAALIEALR